MFQMDDIAEQQRPADSAPPDHFAKFTIGDGNCLARSLSAAVFGTEDYHTEIRVRLAIELALRRNTYLSPEYVGKGCTVPGQEALIFLHASGDFALVPSLEVAFDCEVVAAVANSRDLGVWHLLAAANIFNTKIVSIFPTPNPHMNRVCEPTESTTTMFPLYIQWTSNRNRELDATWTANHVVPVVKMRNYVVRPDSIQVGDYVTSEFTSTEGTTKVYRAVVVTKPTWMPQLDGEVVVKCMRARDNGKYYVFPDVDDISSVPLGRVKKSAPPTINSRGHHFFGC
jgi:hypothetical protein